MEKDKPMSESSSTPKQTKHIYTAIAAQLEKIGLRLLAEGKLDGIPKADTQKPIKPKK
jgi:hypothetical protein